VTRRPLLSPFATCRLIAGFVARPEQRRVGPSALAVLTEREREALVLEAAGRNEDEIAAAVMRSAATAKTHIGRAMAGLGARGRARPVVAADDTGLVTAGRAR
jgi:DNA-binding CsgD family transcriptional regulator